MTFAVRVKATADDEQYLFERNFATTEEFQSVVNHCINSRTIGSVEATLITVRTDTFRHFCKDFFLPTVVNHALRVHDIGQKILAIIFEGVFDICTFPIRLITLLPRHFYNMRYPRQDHPLYRYLLSQGVAPEALNTDQVFLELKWLEGRRGWPGVLGEFESDRNITTGGTTFNFIELPESDSIRIRQLERRGITPPRLKIEEIE